MGAWGTGLFSDDFALDVQSAYQDLIANGATADEAKPKVISRFAPDVRDDPDSEAVFWLALAATASGLGRLDDDLKTRALAIIGRGVDGDLWNTPKLSKARQKVLTKLGSQLKGPQPTAKAVKKPKVYTTDWHIGEVIALKTLAGAWALLHVIGHHSIVPHRFAVCELLSWRGDALPPDQVEIDSAKIESLLRRGPSEPPVKHHRFALSGADSRNLKARIVRLGMYRKPAKGLLARMFSPNLPDSGLGLEFLGVGYIDHYLASQGQRAKT